MNTSIAMNCFRVFLALFLTLLGSSTANANDPGFLEDTHAQARECAALGPAWQARVSKAVGLAKARTKRLLPKEPWPVFSGPASRAAVRPSASQIANCEALVRVLSDPDLPRVLRGAGVTSVFAEATAGCAAAFPDMAKELRASYLDAFARNDLVPDAEYYDELARTSWRRELAGDEDFRKQCREQLKSLKGADFDLLATEEAARKFFED
jgi:hypothetical protein